MLKEKFIEVRELLSDPNRWCQWGAARDHNGVIIDALHETACQWCLYGAITKVGDSNKIAMFIELENFISKRWGINPNVFNDNSNHDGIVSMLDSLIKTL